MTATSSSSYSSPLGPAFLLYLLVLLVVAAAAAGLGDKNKGNNGVFCASSSSSSSVVSASFLSPLPPPPSVSRRRRRGERRSSRRPARRFSSSSFFFGTRKRRRQWRNSANISSSSDDTTSPKTDPEESEEESSPSSIVDDASDEVVAVADEVESPVLRQVLPSMLEYRRRFGHPNVPLGNRSGRLCQHLRQLKRQNKLCQADVALLDGLKFRWSTSLEDAYEMYDFDDMVRRLERYALDHDGDASPPKKYDADPELGAWTASVRRRGKQQIAEELSSLDDGATRVARLDATNFNWNATTGKKCGSKFMKQYREILSRLDEADGDGGEDGVWADPEVRKFVRAQQEAARRGTLSETRTYYMEQLVSRYYYYDGNEGETDDNDNESVETWLDWIPPTTPSSS